MGEVTQSESRVERFAPHAAVPGALLVFSDRAPQYRVLTLRAGATLPLGQQDFGGLPVPDARVSRAHAELSFKDGRFTVTDLGSRNGTFIDSTGVEGTVQANSGAVLRLAQTVLLLLDDVQRFITGRMRVEEDLVVGPGLQDSLDLATLARRGGLHLLVHGETGVGKELVARTYAEAWTPRGPYVRINGAGIPRNMAEAALFGVLPNAATGVGAALGCFRAANGGVLFIDEVAELDAHNQAQLLRAAQNGEVMPIGASVPTTVDVRIVSASCNDLREGIAQGRFREDLFYRLAASEVSVRALRARREEMPWLMQLALGPDGLPLHSSLVEAALLRQWPGNIRELMTETRNALTNARRADANAVRAEHLREAAGLASQRIGGSPGGAATATAPAPAKRASSRPRPTRDEVVAALERNGGNVSATARDLGLIRNQLNRLRRTYGLMPLDAGAPGEDPVEDGPEDLEEEEPAA